MHYGLSLHAYIAFFWIKDTLENSIAEAFVSLEIDNVSRLSTLSLFYYCFNKKIQHDLPFLLNMEPVIYYPDTTFKINDSSPMSLKWSLDEELIILGCGDSVIRMISSSTGDLQHTIDRNIYEEGH